MERARDFLHYRAANLAMHPLDVRRTHERALIAAQQERRHFDLLDVRAHHPSAVLAPCARLRIEAKGPRASRQLLGAEQREPLDIQPRQVGLRRLPPCDFRRHRHIRRRNSGGGPCGASTIIKASSKSGWVTATHCATAPPIECPTRITRVPRLSIKPRTSFRYAGGP